VTETIVTTKAALTEAIVDAVMPIAERWGAAQSRYDRANEYALNLVIALARKYPAVEGFKPFDDLLGKLTQIDNMTCKLPEGFGDDGEVKS
jgi:hypothetical protein